MVFRTVQYWSILGMVINIYLQGLVSSEVEFKRPEKVDVENKHQKKFKFYILFTEILRQQ
jgi:hypothetical protein